MQHVQPLPCPVSLSLGGSWWLEGSAVRARARQSSAFSPPISQQQGVLAFHCGQHWGSPGSLPVCGSSLQGEPGLQGLPGRTGQPGSDGSPGLGGKPGLSGLPGEQVSTLQRAAIPGELGLGACPAPALLLPSSPQGLQGFRGDRGLAGEKGEEVRWCCMGGSLRHPQHLVL